MTDRVVWAETYYWDGSTPSIYATANDVRAINGSAAAAAALAATQPTITTCHTAGGTPSAIVLQSDSNFPVPTGLGPAWRAIYFSEVRNVLAYNAGTLTVTLEGAFSTPVEGGQDIQFFQVGATVTRNQDVEISQREVKIS